MEQTTTNNVRLLGDPVSQDDFEAGMLSMIWLDENLEFVKLDRMDKELFELPSNQVIFEKLKELRENDKPCDMLLLFNGYGFTKDEARQIQNNTHVTTGPINFNLYYNTLLNLFMKRKALELAYNKISFEEYTESINKYTQIDDDIKIFDTRKDMPKFMNELERFLKGGFPLYKFGMEGLDDLLGDVTDGIMAVVAGKTSTGKTWMMLQAGYHLAKQGIPVLYLSCEMGHFKLLKRVIQNMTGINLRAGTYEDLMRTKEMEDVVSAMNELEEKTFIIAEMSEFNERKINNIIKTYNSKVVLLDFIQQFNLNDKSETRAAQVSDIANGIKRMAQKKDIFIVVGSQLNKTSPVWDLGALKESMGIAEATDLAIMLERIDDSFDSVLKRVDYKVHVSKNRDGNTGFVDMTFSFKDCKFTKK